MVKKGIDQYLPILDWLRNYKRSDFTGDLTAGVIVAIMLAPQSMAYALLAGLPPQVGLYASIFPLLIYSVFGTSRSLAVGPVALVSLMVASSLGDIAAAGNDEYMAAAIVLALLSGLMLLALGFLRFGVLANFLSHTVISGFTSAAALVIGFSQFKHLLGIDIPRSHLITDTIGFSIQHANEINIVTVMIAVLAILVLFMSKNPTSAYLRRRGVNQPMADALSRLGPFIIVVISTLAVWLLKLDQNMDVKVVGAIPDGLPSFTMPMLDLELWKQLFIPAFMIAVVGYLESISVAKSLASKRHQRIDSDQELIALGAANVGSAVTGGYPVTGGFSRSVVNFSAGVNTPLASMITATLIALTVLLLTPLFYYLPKAILAVIVFVAVFSLLDFKTFQKAWNFNKSDAVSLVVTFITVLVLGVEIGIGVGVLISMAMYIWRTSQPHIAIVGRVAETEHYRNIHRHEVKTCPHVLAVRVDGSMYFANTHFLEDYICNICMGKEDVKFIVLICSAVDFIDSSALHTLESLAERLREGGVMLHLSEVNGPVMDRLKKTDFLDKIKPGQVFMSTHQAMEKLKCIE